jgi:thiol-disulfide isomerase/thioredoxin
MRTSRFVSILLLLGLSAVARVSSAVPAFARKYKTSCVTCHTIFPKLTPFGEQFRRNGFRFPGIDSDQAKAEPIALGTDESKTVFPEVVWPGTLSPFPALAIGLNGTTMIHPDKNSAAAQGRFFNADSLIAEAQVWAAGSFDDSITYFGEVVVADGAADLENAGIYFNDLLGPAHAVNLVVGKRPATLTSFGPHSTYVSDMALPLVPVTGLFGATSEAFAFPDNHNSIELGGVLGGRFDYATGIAAGTNIDYRNSSNLYAHLGYKLGASTLDGENTGGVAQDLEHEQSLTMDAFIYRSSSQFTDGANAAVGDTALTVGGAIRGQAAGLELDVGVYTQKDDHIAAGSQSVTTIAQWDEASYLLYPWLVAAVRLDYLHVKPNGGDTATSLKVTPGIAALLRPNLKLAITVPIEHATGTADVTWEVAGLSVAPEAGSSVTELESVTIGLFTAF